MDIFLTGFFVRSCIPFGYTVGGGPEAGYRYVDAGG